MKIIPREQRVPCRVHSLRIYDLISSLPSRSISLYLCVPMYTLKQIKSSRLILIKSEVTRLNSVISRSTMLIIASGAVLYLLRIINLLTLAVARSVVIRILSKRKMMRLAIGVYMSIIVFVGYDRVVVVSQDGCHYRLVAHLLVVTVAGRDMMYNTLLLILVPRPITLDMIAIDMNSTSISVTVTLPYRIITNSGLHRNRDNTAGTHHTSNSDLTTNEYDFMITDRATLVNSEHEVVRVHMTSLTVVYILASGDVVSRVQYPNICVLHRVLHRFLLRNVLNRRRAIMKSRHIDKMNTIPKMLTHNVVYRMILNMSHDLRRYTNSNE